MVACVLEQGWTIAATAERFQVTRRPYVSGATGSWPRATAECFDCSSRPRRSPNRTRPQLVKRAQVGYRYIHSAIDDRTRLVYSEIHSDEQAVTAAAFWSRPAA